VILDILGIDIFWSKWKI